MIKSERNKYITFIEHEHVVSFSISLSNLKKFMMYGVRLNSGGSNGDNEAGTCLYDSISSESLTDYLTADYVLHYWCSDYC